MVTRDPAEYVTPLIVKLVTVSVFDSGSVSLVSTLPAATVASGIVLLSFTASGTSLTGIIAKFKLAVSVAPELSCTV